MEVRLVMASQIAPRPLVRMPKPVRNAAYRKFIRSQPCSVTGRTWGVEACHTGSHGISQKASDLDVIPLTRELHRTGPYALDKIGRVAFERRFGIDIAKTIRVLLIRADAAGIDLAGDPPKKPMGRAKTVEYQKRRRA